MNHDFTPLLRPTELAGLRPTQMTVGFREVARKRQSWRKRADKDGPQFLGQHLIPVVIGPGEKRYVIDNHHLALALLREGVQHCLTKTIADLRALDKTAFWTFMDNRNWLHPFDAEGKRRPRQEIPKTLEALADDPYRSLAGELRRAGGYAKDETPYSEFLWGDFLRRRIDRKRVDGDFKTALDEALTVSRSPEARYLPGWCGPE
jgi:hypothetical protein